MSELRKRLAEKRGVPYVERRQKATPPPRSTPISVQLSPSVPANPLVPVPAWLQPLVDAEARYYEALRGVRLVGELDIQVEDYRRLRETIATLVSQRTANGALRTLQGQFPRVLAVYLVAAGIYGYDDGDFWTEVRRHTSLVGDQGSSVLGQWFLTFLRDHSLETFSAFPVGALQYVSRILGHGGIPAGDLPDLFDHLAALLTRPEWQAADARSLLAFWEAQRYATQRFDKPTERFLQFGGEVSANFLARVLMLMTSPEGMDPRALGLPQRVGDAWRAWVAANSAEAASIEARQRQTRLVSPWLECDPWSGVGPEVHLPEQPIPDGVPGPFLWRIRADDTTDEYPAQGYGGMLHAEPRPLRQPAGLVEVSLLAEGGAHLLRTWRLAGITDRVPIIAFTSRTWRQIAWDNVVSGVDLNVVLGPGVSIAAVRSDGDGDVVEPLLEHETYQRLSGAWAGYRHIALRIPSRTTRLRLERDGDSDGTPLLIVRGEADQPHIDLSEVNVPGVRGGVAQVPVLHTPPKLVLPAAAWRDGSAAWTVRAELRTGYADIQRRGLPLGELMRERRSDGALVVDLQHPDLLPTDRACEVWLQAHGPLGSDVDAAFVLVPGLAVDDRDDAMNVAREERSDARVRVRSACPLDVAPIGQEQVRADNDGWIVFVPNRQASLELRAPARLGGRESDLPTLLHIPVAGMLWGVSSGSQRTLPTLARDVLRLSSRDIDEPGGAVLVLVGLGEAAQVVLSLRDRHGHVIGAPRRLETYRHRTSVNLRNWATELAVAGASPLQIIADVRTSVDTRIAYQHVATVLPDGHVDGWVVRDAEQGETIRLQVHWQERSRLQGRLLRLWHLDQPWHTPQTWLVPDAAAGFFEITLLKTELLPGNYRLALAIDDPWALDTDLSIPSASASFDTRLGLGAELRREWWQPDGMTVWQSALTRALSQGDPELVECLPQPDLPPDEVLTVLERLTHTLEQELHPDLPQLARLISAVSTQVAVDERLLAPVWSQIAAHHADPQASLRHLLLFGLPTAEPDSSIVRALRQLDPPRRQILEHQHPWLFLIQRDRIVADADGDTTVLAQAQALLGTSLTNMVRPAGQILDHDAVFKSSSLEPTEHWHYPYGRLRRVSEFLVSIMPEDYLGDSGHFTALFDWLLRLNDPADLVGRGEQAHWISEHLGLVMADLRRVRQSAAGRHPGLSLATELLGNRHERISSGLMTDYLPTICGCVALFQRLHARHPALASVIILPERQLLLDSRRLAAAAPALYGRDLSLFDLLCLASGHEGEAHLDGDERSFWR